MDKVPCGSSDIQHHVQRGWEEFHSTLHQAIGILTWDQGVNSVCMAHELAPAPLSCGPGAHREHCLRPTPTVKEVFLESRCPVKLQPQQNWYSHYGWVWRFLKKSKNRTTIWPRNSTSECIFKANEIRTLKSYLHFHVHCRITHNSQNMEII